MRIYQLTALGRDMARTPTREMTPGWRVIYYLRRHGGRATDEQIRDFAPVNAGEFPVVIGNLVRQKIVVAIG